MTPERYTRHSGLLHDDKNENNLFLQKLRADTVLQIQCQLLISVFTEIKR